MKKDGQRVPGLVLGALGIVFGDIGTSPLYAIAQCFRELHTKSPSRDDVLGILSLVFWSIILVVCGKYLTFLLRADFNGEGGTLALLGLIREKGRGKVRPLGGLVLLVFLGSALLYGDGVITPSISVLSAVEGLKVATPAAQPFIVPICLVILAALFLVQHFGTEGVGKCFGPVMFIWFLAIGTLGGFGIAHDPRVLSAVNPLDAFYFLGRHGPGAIMILGAVVLAFSGVEALFADLGHFGRLPIRAAWYLIALPALISNYFGQGAIMLASTGSADSPFFALVPRAMLYPIVALATVATIIASQAVISGAFSLTQQAINLGYLPPFRVVHTCEHESGQIYVGAVNWTLMIACLAVVVGFQSSERLTAAYGLALSGTMTVTTLTFYVVLRRVRGWGVFGALALVGVFLVIDLAFLAGNAVKILSGAWFPVLIALFVFAIYWIWTAGHNRYKLALRRESLSIKKFCRELAHSPHRHAGTAIFLTGHPDAIPLLGGNAWLRQQAHHEQVVLVTVSPAKVPWVSDGDASRLERVSDDVLCLTTEYGFMQQPDITRILKCKHADALKLDWNELVCFLPEPKILIRGNLLRRLVARVYSFLRRNSLSLADYFNVPPREIIHVGVRLEI